MSLLPHSLSRFLFIIGSWPLGYCFKSQQAPLLSFKVLHRLPHGAFIIRYTYANSSRNQRCILTHLHYIISKISIHMLGKCLCNMLWFMVCHIWNARKNEFEFWVLPESSRVFLCLKAMLCLGLVSRQIWMHIIHVHLFSWRARPRVLRPTSAAHSNAVNHGYDWGNMLVLLCTLLYSQFDYALD